MRSRSAFAFVGLASLSQFHWLPVAANNFSTTPWEQSQSLLPRQVTAFDDRPADCPPCFNCNLEDFQCQQFGSCGVSSGKCKCPEGFGGDDCGTPLCGSPADGLDRALRLPGQKECQCSEGWDGINCNVCTNDIACDALMPEGKDGVCYQSGLVQKQNYQFCDVTNKGIVDALDPRKPQATFSCNAANQTCDFQSDIPTVWVAHQESFYCALDTCHWDMQSLGDRNITTYSCDHIKCRCIPGRFLCGEGGGIDISDFVNKDITGPATFRSVSSNLDQTVDKTTFEEPHLDGLISTAFGDDSILLSCTGGECLYKTELPGYEEHVVKPIDTRLVAGIISGCASFVIVLSLVFVWLSRKKNAPSSYNKVRLEDEYEANAALMADHKPATLHFENVSYRVGGKQILSDVQGSVHPGELLAIIGASGAGKTTFLDILARKNKRGSTRGSFYVNGEKISDDEFRNIIGFVDQEDTMLPTLTVHETILDSAMLRLPRTMSLAAKQQKAEDVERQLGIHHIRDSIIGSAEGRRGISGGEKRRVSIACELVTSPSILFLDEPTSGLDASNAYNVVECLVNLAKMYNRTVVFSIHQPRSNIIALFDHLVLLAKGRTVYSGPFSKCQTYFKSIGYSCPEGFNIADYLLDLTVHAGKKRASMDETAVLNPITLKDRANQESLIGSRTRAESVTSIREQQERLLFTRKSTDTIDSIPHSTEELPKELQDPTWLEMSETTGSTPLIADNPHSFSDKVDNGNGTNLDTIIDNYYISAIAAQVQEDIREAVDQAGKVGSSNSNTKARTKSVRLRGYRKIGILRQFMILATRTWRNLYRNPMLLLTHYAISILLAVLLGYLFFGLTNDIAGFQNRMGILSFVLALFGFSTLTTLTVFADERLLFMRERAKGYYHPSAYFAAKVFFDIVPLRLVPPIILSIIVYPMTGLVATWSHFFTFVLVLVLFNFAAAAVCLLIGIVVREGGTANLLGSLVMLFSLLFSGLFLNHDKIPGAAMWLQQLSIFHYAFEGLLINEVRLLTLMEHKYGLNVEVPGASILSSFGFRIQALWTDVTGLGVFAGVFILLGYAAMHFLLVEKR